MPPECIRLQHKHVNNLHLDVLCDSFAKGAKRDALFLHRFLACMTQNSSCLHVMQYMFYSWKSNKSDYSMQQHVL